MNLVPDCALYTLQVCVWFLPLQDFPLCFRPIQISIEQRKTGHLEPRLYVLVGKRGINEVGERFLVLKNRRQVVLHKLPLLLLAVGLKLPFQVLVNATNLLELCARAPSVHRNVVAMIHLSLRFEG